MSENIIKRIQFFCCSVWIPWSQNYVIINYTYIYSSAIVQLISDQHSFWKWCKLWERVKKKIISCHSFLGIMDREKKDRIITLWSASELRIDCRTVTMHFCMSFNFDNGYPKSTKTKANVQMLLNFVNSTLLTAFVFLFAGVCECVLLPLLLVVLLLILDFFLLLRKITNYSIIQ